MSERRYVDESRSAWESSSGLTMVKHRPFDMCEFCSEPSEGLDWRGRTFPLCQPHRIEWEARRLDSQKGKR